MRKRDVQIGVNPGSRRRAPGDAPSMGRVTRMSRQFEPSLLGRRRRSSSRSQNEKSSKPWKSTILWLWSGLLALLALGIIGVAIGLWLSESKRSAARQDLASDASAALIPSRTNFPSPSETDALALVRSALEIPNEAEVARLFRLQGVSPEVAISGLEQIERNEGPVNDLKWLGSIDANGLVIDGVVVSRGDPEQADQRLALLTPDESGLWQMDFDAYARPAIPDWETIRDTGVEGVVRARIAPDHYYNGPFSSDSAWACYALLVPGIDTAVLGYCLRDSVQYRAIERILKPDTASPAGSQVKRVTLSIRSEPDGDGRQFRILRVLAEDWVLGDQPYDERQQ